MRTRDRGERVAARRRHPQDLGWCASIALTAAAVAGVAGALWRAATPGGTPASLGRTCRADAVAAGGDLCARLTGGPCRLRDITADLTPRHDAGVRFQPEWQLMFEAKRGLCYVRLDTDTGALIAFGLEYAPYSDPTAPAADRYHPPNGDAGTLSRREAEWSARRCLTLAGLAPPGAVLPVRAVDAVVEGGIPARHF